jgi:hypothetical protein
MPRLRTTALTSANPASVAAAVSAVAPALRPDAPSPLAMKRSRAARSTPEISGTRAEGESTQRAAVTGSHTNRGARRAIRIRATVVSSASWTATANATASSHWEVNNSRGWSRNPSGP